MVFRSRPEDCFRVAGLAPNQILSLFPHLRGRFYDITFSFNPRAVCESRRPHSFLVSFRLARFPSHIFTSLFLNVCLGCVGDLNRTFCSPVLLSRGAFALFPPLELWAVKGHPPLGRILPALPNTYFLSVLTPIPSPLLLSPVPFVLSSPYQSGPPVCHRAQMRFSYAFSEILRSVF